MALNRAGHVGPLQGMLVPAAGSSEYLAVTTSSAEVNGTGLAAADLHVFTCSVDCYIAQGATPTANSADGSMFVPAGMPVLIDGAQGAKVAVKGTAAGHCTLQKVTTI